MRRLAISGVGVAAIWLSVAPALAGWEPPPRPKPPAAGSAPEEQPGLFQRLFGPAAKPAKTTYDPTPKQAAATASRPATAARPAAAPAEPASDFDKDQRTYLRRLAVCDKLREIARESNDEELNRRADQLEQRAWSACMQRSGPMPVDDSVDDRILEKHLAPTAGQTSGLSSKTDRLYTVPSTRTGHAQAREDER